MKNRCRGWLCAALLLCAFPLNAQLSPQMQAAIDQVVASTLAAQGSPSASISIVKDGQIVYAKAYKDASVQPQVPATPDMIYHIGSVSKQFTATVILMLIEQGMLTLEDKVANFLPDLTRANEVSLKQLLSHTSGYQDFWPQDYAPAIMQKPTTVEYILDKWGKMPLDFDPGTQYQYSNTGYVIAGVIAEIVSGVPLFSYLQKRVFGPLNMTSVIDTSSNATLPDLPVPYSRNALGPLRKVKGEGENWMFAAGELAMTASDLALWNIAMIEQRLLKPQSYAVMQREVLLKDGVGTNYGLGLEVGKIGTRRVLQHDGEVIGFTAQNMIFPDDNVTISVLVNQDVVSTAKIVANQIAAILFAGSGQKEAEAEAQNVLENLQQGKIDRTLFSTNGNGYFSAQVLSDFASSLAPLGAVKSVMQTFETLRGGMNFRLFTAVFVTQSIAIWQRTLANGLIEEFMVTPI